LTLLAVIHVVRCARFPLAPMTAPTDTTNRKRRPRSARLRALGARLGLLAATIVAILLVAEVATRLFTRTQPPLFENHPVLGKTFVPGLVTTRRIGESRRNVDFRFNHEGFRDPERPERKPSGVRRVAVLGDSMIAAMQVDEEETLVRLLERQLQASVPEVTWEVMNFGISGAGPGQALVVYREVARRYDPDLVLFAFFVGNDLGDVSRELTSNKHRIYFRLDDAGRLAQIPNSVTRSRVTTWLNRHSRFYVWQKVRVDKMRADAREALDMLATGKLVYDTRPEAEVERAWDLLESLIEELEREVAADGAAFAVAVLPAAEQVLDERWQAILDIAGPARERLAQDNPERRVRTIGEAHGVAVVTLLDAFRAAAPRHSLAYPDEWLHFNGDGHFNEAGHRVAAGELHDFLVHAAAGRALLDAALAR
jgi:hypothetical protein